MTRVLGVDPGLHETGWAVIDGASASPRLVASGVIRTLPGVMLPQRLKAIHAELGAVLAEHAPDSCAMEEMFFTTIAVTVRATLQARGVALLAVAQAGHAVHEYNPKTVKLTLTGSGRAEKAQMQTVVMKALGLAERLRPNDVADAAAIALCHMRAGRVKGMKVLDSWGSGTVIASLRGVVLSKDLESLILEVGGVGHEIHTTAAAASRAAVGSELLLMIVPSYAMYGGGETLYGFLDASEKAMFCAFRDEIPGTGAKKALEYLDKASKSLPDFRRAVIERDDKMLCAVFGFSKKTAVKIVDALKGKLEDVRVSGSPHIKKLSEPALPAGSWSQALSALEALGYKQSEVRSALQSLAEEHGGKELPAEQLVRQALKRL